MKKYQRKKQKINLNKKMICSNMQTQQKIMMSKLKNCKNKLSKKLYHLN